jgi:DNA-binding NarL/FixJ family response regulator
MTGLVHRPDVVRVAVLDRHPAVRLGVAAMLRDHAGLEPVGGAAGVEELWPLLRRVDPDVLLVDHRAGAPDRLLLCLRLRVAFRARVLLWATDGEPELALAANLAGARGLVDKAEPPATLVAAIRAVAGGANALPAVPAAVQAAAAARLSPADRAVFAMALAGTSRRDIAAVCGIPSEALDARLAHVIATLLGVAPAAASHGRGAAA